jgi:hypothetical protein
MEKKFKLKIRFVLVLNQEICLGNQFNELMNLNGYKRVTQDLIYQ